jgi:hypothetical protein
LLALPFAVFDPTCNTDEVLLLKSLVASSDGFQALSTNSEGGTLGFADMDPYHPKAASYQRWRRTYFLPLAEPMLSLWVNTSKGLRQPSGIFHVIDVASQTVLRIWRPSGTQPDSVGIRS